VRVDGAQRDPVVVAALVIAVGGLATILGAWYFQLVLGLQPCPLCLQQRWPYYAGIPLALLIAAAAGRGMSRRVLVAGLAVLVLVLLVGAGLGVYHSGVEWKWWAGPADCSGAGFSGGSAGTLLQQMQTVRVVRCDEAPWRFLGLSLAGWNVLIALALAAIGAAGILSVFRRTATGQSRA
jgi:disulfide bond formation protein DsbB